MRSTRAEHTRKPQILVYTPTTCKKMSTRVLSAESSPPQIRAQILTQQVLKI